MIRKTFNNFKLGIFVIAGLSFLILALYIIGKNQNLFSAKFTLKARFHNVNGLMPGNNVRYSGIQAGTVKAINIINDTTIEVVFFVDKNIRNYIRKNSMVSIGTEGLMGNKVLNIAPNPELGDPVKEDDLLYTWPETNVDDVLQTLYKTNDNIQVISSELKQTVARINNSSALWAVLNDEKLPSNLSALIANVKIASENIKNSSYTLNTIVQEIGQGSGIAGLLLKDKIAAQKMSSAITNIQKASTETDNLITRLDSIARAVQLDMNNKRGVVYTLLKDTSLATQLTKSLNNIEKGTAAFNEDMEALKHNFLLRGYFKKQEKKSKNNAK